MLTLSNAKFVTEHAKYPTRYLNMFCNYLQTEVPSTTQTLKMADKEEHVQRAKLAEQAERYRTYYFPVFRIRPVLNVDLDRQDPAVNW
jgi:hypothetical protein